MVHCKYTEVIVIKVVVMIVAVSVYCIALDKLAGHWKENEELEKVGL